MPAGPTTVTGFSSSRPLRAMVESNPKRPKQWSPCKCVIRTRSIFPIRTVLVCSRRCCVASPQSTSTVLPLDRVTATALVLRAGVGVAEEVPRNTTRETVGGVRLFPLPGKSISMHVAVLDRLRSSTLCWVELGAADVAASARPRGTLRLDMPAKSGNKSAASKPPFFF